MVHRLRPDKNKMQIYDAGPDTTVRVADLVVSEQRNLAAGITEYLKPSRLEWTFEYDEVFYMIEGALEINVEGKGAVRFEVGDIGFVEKGTTTTIIVPKQAYFLHVTQPAWRE